jgi:hypothetical protein
MKKEATETAGMSQPAEISAVALPGGPNLFIANWFRLWN